MWGFFYGCYQEKRCLIITTKNNAIYKIINININSDNSRLYQIFRYRLLIQPQVIIISSFLIHNGYAITYGIYDQVVRPEILHISA